jgi:NAD(P) transhydrogenase subunit alpha
LLVPFLFPVYRVNAPRVSLLFRLCRELFTKSFNKELGRELIPALLGRSGHGRAGIKTIVGIPKEIAVGERRVALVPESLSKLTGLQTLLEHDAGAEAGFPDDAYKQAGAQIAPEAKTLYGQSDFLLKVQPPTPAEVDLFKEGSTLVSFLYPLMNQETVKKLLARKVTAFAMDLMPRITRAQATDALSSQATVSGYKAVLLAANSLPKLFPMLMTAAGTVSPARVFVLGAGVAGLQAIAVSRRLGAVVEAYDVRPAVKEEVSSLGARFVELPLETKEAQGAGGYAKAQSEDFYIKQQALLAEHARTSDVVITTALVQGKRAPLLISEEAVKGMKPGSVIVDLAAETGGNCALTEPGKTVVKYGVTIIGPLNLPSTMAPQASTFYSKNITAFLAEVRKGGGAADVSANFGDDMVRGALLTYKGEVMHDRTKTAMEAGRT